jgi:hypothetical protein
LRDKRFFVACKVVPHEGEEVDDVLDFAEVPVHWVDEVTVAHHAAQSSYCAGDVAVFDRECNARLPLADRAPSVLFVPETEVLFKGDAVLFLEGLIAVVGS